MAFVMSKTHFFASCALGWARGETRDEAVEKLVRSFRKDFKSSVAAMHKSGVPGTYVWSCKVIAPIDARYSINHYAPHGPDTADGCHHHVTYVTDKLVSFTTEQTCAVYWDDKHGASEVPE